MTDLKRPVIDWAALAKGLSVPTCSVCTDGELAEALMRAFAERGATEDYRLPGRSWFHRRVVAWKP